MHFKVIHPEGYVLNEGLEQTDAYTLCNNVFLNIGKRCTLVNLDSGEESKWPPAGAKSDAKASDDDDDNGAPAKSASRAEWDDYAESQGVDPSEFATKDDLIAKLT